MDKIKQCGVIKHLQKKIAETVGISYKRAQNIIMNELGFSKIFARWILRLLSAKQKRNRFTISRDRLGLFEANPQEFWNRFVTMDETWVYHYIEKGEAVYIYIYIVLPMKLKGQTLIVYYATWEKNFILRV